ncbi:MAG: hypothetical protein V1915_04215 [Candidatus Bathyarchaeota archaeon]
MAVIQTLAKLDTLQKVVKFLGNWQEQPTRDSLVDSVFQLLLKGKITAAKTVLEKMKQKSESSIWRRGYINALDGMVVASETKDDPSVFINQITLEKCEDLRRNFLQQSRNDRQSEFDKGFFSAWSDYLQMLHESRMESSSY